MSRSHGVFIVVILAATLPACAMDPAEHQPELQQQREELTSSQSDTSVDNVVSPDENLASRGEPEPAEVLAGCSIVQFCNAPGADGTRCLQQGCDRIPAEVECIDESITVCGGPICPLIFVERNGSRRDLCQGL